MISTQEWHQRFLIQAGWTSELRRHLYHRVSVPDKSRILEVGCGTGALLNELAGENSSIKRIFGLDINTDYLTYLRSHSKRPHIVQADAHQAPYAGASFDIVYCHFLLLWAENPQNLVSEMKRLTRQGGVVIAFAEPDYGGRIDYPDILTKLGHLQEEALTRQGADTRIGRRLAELFEKAGLQEIEVGVLGGQWNHPTSIADWKSEWLVMFEDLKAVIPPDELTSLQELDFLAIQQGHRVLFVPTFYALGMA